MFYNVIYPLSEHIGIFNLFQYLTVRSGGALITAFLLSLAIGPWLIQKFRVLQTGGNTVKDIAHSSMTLNSKMGTPTMGGVLVLVTVLTGVLLWADLTNPYVWLLISVMLGFGAIGILDDYLNLTKKWMSGVPGVVRLSLQAVISIAIISMIIRVHGGVEATAIYMPFFKEAVVGLGLVGFLLFACFVIVGSANAVNLTDGLDGLVAIPAVITASTLALIAYIAGRSDFTQYLNIAHIPGAGEVAVVCAALAGSCLGFLWYNAPPARIFMGDTGALSIGAMLGTISIIIKQEFVLAIVGGLFVLETASVIIQVVSYKLTGKRVFRMAPLHHHFEQLGWPETTIVVRFWIIAIILAMIGLATLKLR